MSRPGLRSFFSLQPVDVPKKVLNFRRRRSGGEKEKEKKGEGEGKVTVNFAPCILFY